MCGRKRRQAIKLEGNVMLISETWLDADKGWQLGESDPYEPYTDDTGTLFRALQREYGRCVSRVYVDTPDGAKACGWVFQKRRQYDDCKDSYLAETWVTLYDAPDTVTREHHYHFMQ
jgi:hypothetical protein